MKIKTDKAEHSFQKNIQIFAFFANLRTSRLNIAQRLHTGTGTAERALQTLKNLFIINMEDNLCLAEFVNRALNVMRFTIHSGLKITLFELHHGRKPRTELTNVMKTRKQFISNWSEKFISANNRPKTPIYVTRNGEGSYPTTISWPEQKTKNRLQLKSHRKREIRLVTIPSNSSKRIITRNNLQVVDSRKNYKQQ